MVAKWAMTPIEIICGPFRRSPALLVGAMGQVRRRHHAAGHARYVCET